MKSDRDRYLAKLSPPELLLYAACGGELVTREMKAGYAKALAWLGLTVAPSAEALAKLLAEGLPRGKAKPARPLVYRPFHAARTGRPPQGMRRTRKVGRKAKVAA